MIIACIVTYNPDITRLKENINSILPQVGKVIIFDNGSDNVQDVITEFEHLCTITRSVDNIGIASALNELCHHCEKIGCEWVLTLDQDSVCPGNLMVEYSKLLSQPNVGMLSPRINDRNVGILDWNSDAQYDEIDACITSASLINLEAWRNVGGFWDDLFIDMVDFDMCWSLREKGYKILRVNTVSLLHEIGHSTSAVFRGSKVAILNHNPKRYYYIFRNTIAVGRRHHRLGQCLRWNVKRLWLVLRYEKNRGKKLWSIVRGTYDGVIMDSSVGKKVFWKNRFNISFIRFCIVGVIATAIHYGIYWLLLKVMSPTLAFTIGYAISFCCNFIMTTKFTFKKKATPKKGFGFAMSHLVNYGLQTGSLNLFIFIGIPEQFAAIPVYFICVPINYLLVRLFWPVKTEHFFNLFLSYVD